MDSKDWQDWYREIDIDWEQDTIDNITDFDDTGSGVRILNVTPRQVR